MVKKEIVEKRSMPYWLKGGIWGLIIGIIVSSFFTWFIHNSMICAIDMLGAGTCGLTLVEWIYFIIVGTIIITLIGFIVGYIVGKLKKAKNNIK